MSRDEVLLHARKTAAVVHRILAVLYLIYFAFLASVLLPGDGGKEGVDYWFIIIPLIPMAIHIFAAQGLRNNKAWGRPLSVILGFLLIIGFPIGTLCGVIILYQMFRKEWSEERYT